jgi:hypothetical protein
MTKPSITVSSPNGRRAHEVSVDGAIAALAELGIRVVSETERQVFDAARNVKLGYASGDVRFPFISEGGFELALAIHAEREGRGEKP